MPTTADACSHPDCAGQFSLFREQQGQRSVDHCLRDNYSGGGEHYFCRTRTHYPPSHAPPLPPLPPHTHRMHVSENFEWYSQSFTIRKLLFSCQEKLTKN